MDSLRVPTRRELLQRGALLGGALVAGSWGHSTTTAGAASGVALTDERRLIYAALAEPVVTGPSLRLPAEATDQAVFDFEAAYTAWPTERKRHADAVLDALGRGFTTRSRSARADVLRGAAGDARATDLAYRARGLVAVALSSGDTPLEVTV